MQAQNKKHSRPCFYDAPMKSRGIMLPDFLWEYAWERGGSGFIRQLLEAAKEREEYRDSVA